MWRDLVRQRIRAGSAVIPCVPGLSGNRAGHVAYCLARLRVTLPAARIPFRPASIIDLSTDLLAPTRRSARRYGYWNATVDSVRAHGGRQQILRKDQAIVAQHVAMERRSVAARTRSVPPSCSTRTLRCTMARLATQQSSRRVRIDEVGTARRKRHDRRASWRRCDDARVVAGQCHA